MGGVGGGRGWAWDGGGRLFEVGANSRLGAYSNKYGKSLGSTDSNNQENNIRV